MSMHDVDFLKNMGTCGVCLRFYFDVILVLMLNLEYQGGEYGVQNIPYSCNALILCNTRVIDAHHVTGYFPCIKTPHIPR